MLHVFELKNIKKKQIIKQLNIIMPHKLTNDERINENHKP